MVNCNKKTGVDGKPWKPSKYSKICSDHFKNGTTSPIWNHPSYVPTIFPLQRTMPLRLVQQVSCQESNIQQWLQPCLHVGLFLDFPIVGVQDESGVGIMSLLDEQYVEEGRPLSVHWDHDYSKPSFETGKKLVGSARITQFVIVILGYALFLIFWISNFALKA